LDTHSRIFVTFENPPVAEVVCGVQFRIPSKLSVAHLGVFGFQLDGFGNPEDAPPIASVYEIPHAAIDAAVSPVRVWLRSDDGTEIVQLQKDRFLCNWQKRDGDSRYPRYHAIIEKFWSRFKTFEQFVHENCGTSVELTQYELTYINHIRIGTGWKSLGELHQVFKDFSWRSEGHRFLPEPEGVDFQSSFLLPDGAGRMRLHLQSASLSADGSPVLVLNLTVRGMQLDRVGWFDRAHEWIVRGFEDLTQVEMHTIWGKHAATT
jgi:uncharacterized protein (TIGR04255 family)